MRGEIDIMEFGNQLNFHTWDANEVDHGANITPNFMSVSVPSGWHTYGLLVQPGGSVKVYIDGALVYSGTGSTAYNAPMYCILRNVYNTCAPPLQSNEMGFQYVRYWAPQ